MRKTEEIYNEIRRSHGIELPDTINELTSSQIDVKLKIVLNDRLCYETIARLKVTGFAVFESFTLNTPHFVIISVSPFPFLDCDIVGIMITKGTSVGLAHSEFIQTPFRNDKRYYFGIESIVKV